MKSDDLISRAEAIDVIRSMTISLGGKEIFHPEAKKSVVGVLDDLAAVDAVSLGVYEQVKWERDVAIKLLEALGIDFGQKKPDMEPVRRGEWIPKTYSISVCSVCEQPLAEVSE